ncbi:hypothetical protein [Nocardiopsis quinghaiensis]|uniref:hypothetical protein n=1 Tax=Nocardiopsis quinghaiensis TaxID=464995 RepID=UPI001CC25355|nr:hypothetical protein [Nocardiopsis quinghaiensis]
MGQERTPSLFAPDLSMTPEKPVGDRPERMKVLITVKAAPQPSSTYGETVCVAGLRLDLASQGWIRLYPINFRELESNGRFRKYEVINLEARPSHSHDSRPESWRPVIPSIVKSGYLKDWKTRDPYIADYIEESMCRMFAEAKRTKNSRSLAAIRAKVVKGIDIEPHPGWTPQEQRKIDQYVSQQELGSTVPRSALEAPRFKAWYKYDCWGGKCAGHRQGILDWELVALQRRFSELGDDHLKEVIYHNFFQRMCGAERETIFYVGNQAKRQQTFSVLGTYYPKAM